MTTTQHQPQEEQEPRPSDLKSGEILYLKGTLFGGFPLQICKAQYRVDKDWSSLTMHMNFQWMEIVSPPLTNECTYMFNNITKLLDDERKSVMLNRLVVPYVGSIQLTQKYFTTCMQNKDQANELTKKLKAKKLLKEDAGYTIEPEEMRIRFVIGAKQEI